MAIGWASRRELEQRQGGCVVAGHPHQHNELLLRGRASKQWGVCLCLWRLGPRGIWLYCRHHPASSSMCHTHFPARQTASAAGRRRWPPSSPHMLCTVAGSYHSRGRGVVGRGAMRRLSMCTCCCCVICRSLRAMRAVSVRRRSLQQSGGGARPHFPLPSRLAGRSTVADCLWGRG